jgi:hypothetical protein
MRQTCKSALHAGHSSRRRKGFGMSSSAQPHFQQLSDPLIAHLLNVT